MRAQLLKFYKIIILVSRTLPAKLNQFSRSRRPGVIRHFPALHLKSQGSDYLSHFSGEIVAAACIIAVAFFNFLLPYTTLAYPNKDTSLAAAVLKDHQSLNPKLAQEERAISTVINESGGLVAQAHADTIDPTLSSADPGNLDADNDNYTDDGLMVNENLDSVKGLIKVTVHTVQAGETLSSIAQAYGYTSEDLKVANRLPNSTVKPGWNLVIFKGVVYKVQKNDTIGDIAQYFYGKATPDNVDRLVSYNAIGEAEAIHQGQLIFVPDGRYPAPKPSSSAPSRSAYAVPRGGLYKNGHIFPFGQCTYYVAAVFAGLGKHIPWSGNASNWDSTSLAYGAVVNRTPSVGAIIQFNPGRGFAGRYGHVGVVRSISGGMVTFADMNGPQGPGKVGIHTIAASEASNYIHW